MFIRELIPIPKAERMLNMKKDLVKDLMLLGILEYTTTHSMSIYVYKGAYSYSKSRENAKYEKRFSERPYVIRDIGIYNYTLYEHLCL